MNPVDLLLIVGATVLGIIVGRFIIGQKKFDERDILQRAEKLVAHAQHEAKESLVQAKERAIAKKKQFEMEQAEFTAQMDKMEKMMDGKILSLQKREAKISDMQKVLKGEEAVLESLRAQTHESKKNVNEKLMQMTGIPGDKIKDELFKDYENEFQQDAELRLQRHVQWAEEGAIRDARNVLAEAMYRYGAETSLESEEGFVTVSRDEFKGRIVGRGGHIIALFEELFGVDVIFNDEPNIIIVSCFNLVHREVAKQALMRLMREKNITEEIVARVKPLAEQDVQKILRREGEAALKKLNITNMPPDFAELVGRLRFRTSYGQNIMTHCFEVGYFAKLLAGEIGADTHVAFLGGFFHDIGKAIDQEVGGSHDVLSKEILEKYGFSWEITHAAWTHHNAIPQETVEARIVQAADAISAGRPGARAESVERYLAKIKDLQETAFSFAGVKKAFAINAGREVRVVVDPDKVDDAGVTSLAGNIAAKVQEKGGYPGKIKVTTIRLTKATDYAR
ncbi:MAG: Rnase Y domain-containing protein [Patescibacteria group bacterium]